MGFIKEGVNDLYLVKEALQVVQNHVRLEIKEASGEVWLWLLGTFTYRTKMTYFLGNKLVTVLRSCMSNRSLIFFIYLFYDVLDAYQLFIVI